MPLTTSDVLGFVIATLTWYGCTLDTLAVQTACGRMFVRVPLGRSFAADCCPQGIVNALPGAIIAPAAKIGINTLPFRIFFGEHPPLEATDNKIQKCVDYHAHIQFTWRVPLGRARFGHWNQRLDNLPLAGAQVAWINLCLHNHTLSHILSASRYFSNSFSPERVASTTNSTPGTWTRTCSKKRPKSKVVRSGRKVVGSP